MHVVPALSWYPYKILYISLQHWIITLHDIIQTKEYVSYIISFFFFENRSIKFRHSFSRTKIYRLSLKNGAKSTQFQHIYGSSLHNFGLIFKNGVAFERGTYFALLHIIKYCHCLLGASRRRCKKVTLDGKKGRQLWRPFWRSRRLNSTKNYHIKNVARPLADKKVLNPRHLAPIVRALECRVLPQNQFRVTMGRRLKFDLKTWNLAIQLIGKRWWDFKKNPSGRFYFMSILKTKSKKSEK